MQISRRRLLHQLGRGALVGGVAAGSAAIVGLDRRPPALAQSSPSQVGQWEGPYSTPLVGIHAIVLPRTGEVLLLHGDHRGRGSLVYLWNPATMSFTQKATGSNVFCSGHCALPDGRVLLAGGHIDVGKGIRDCNIFTPASRSWSTTTPLAQGRWYPTCTALPDGRVLAVAGGPDTDAAVAVPEVYPGPGANAWTRLTNAARPLPYYPFMFVLPSGKVFNAGPNQDQRILDPAGTGSWTAQVAQGPPLYLGDENVPAVTWIAPDQAGNPVQRILVTGGREVPSALWATRRAWLIAFNQAGEVIGDGGWRRVADMTQPRVQHNAVSLPDGTVLVTGGSTYHNNRNAAVLAAELFDPASETWTAMASAKKGRFHHSTGFLLPDGRVAVTGTDNDKSLEIFRPPYLFKGEQPRITGGVPAGAVGYNTTVPIGVSGPITQVALIRPAATTHAFDQDQRYVRLGFSQTGSTLVISTPASANLAPPGVYMLFVLNEAGVPSVASWLQLG